MAVMPDPYNALTAIGSFLRYCAPTYVADGIEVRLAVHPELFRSLMTVSPPVLHGLGHGPQGVTLFGISVRKDPGLSLGGWRLEFTGEARMRELDG